MFVYILIYPGCICISILPPKKEEYMIQWFMMFNQGFMAHDSFLWRLVFFWATLISCTLKRVILATRLYSGTPATSRILSCAGWFSWKEGSIPHSIHGWYNGISPTFYHINEPNVWDIYQTWMVWVLGVKKWMKLKKKCLEWYSLLMVRSDIRREKTSWGKGSESPHGFTRVWAPSQDILALGFSGCHQQQVLSSEGFYP